MNGAVLTKEKFHEILHTDIKKPIRDSRRQRIPAGNAPPVYINVHTGAHKIEWAEATVFLIQKVININVYLNFKKNSLSISEYNKLVGLAKEGIEQYWSRNIKLGTARFSVRVKAHHRDNRAIPVDLYINDKRQSYNRSMNIGMFGLSAKFIYNKGAGPEEYVKNDFKLVSAHEFGHSVLMYACGANLSWSHKGTTNILNQSLKHPAIKQPRDKPMDLMKYYAAELSKEASNQRFQNAIAMEEDVKRLIWGGELKWVE